MKAVQRLHHRDCCSALQAVAGEFMGCCSMPQSDEGLFACPQEIADEAQGENVLVVTHGDAVNASVSRIWPWAIVHPVTHTGYTVASRERRPGQQIEQDCEDSADVR